MAFYAAMASKSSHDGLHHAAVFSLWPTQNTNHQIAPTWPRYALSLLVARIEPLAHFFAGFEKRYGLGVHLHLFAGAWVAANTRRSVFHRERAKATQFNPVATGKRIRNGIKNSTDYVFNIALVKMGITLSNALNKL
jgi:hypothetical protein